MMLEKRFWSKRRSLEVDTYLTWEVLHGTGKVNMDIPKSNKLQRVFQLGTSISCVIESASLISGCAMFPCGVYCDRFPADTSLCTFGYHSHSFSLSSSGEFQPTKSHW